MRLPAAAILRYVLWACLGRTDGKIQIIRLQTQTSCRLETGMDDCVAAMMATVAAYMTPHAENKKCLISWHSFHVEDAIVARKHICSLCSVHRTAVTFSAQITCFCWRPLAAQYCFHGTLRPSRCICVVVQVRNDLRPRAVLRRGCK